MLEGSSLLAMTNKSEFNCVSCDIFMLVLEKIFFLALIFFAPFKLGKFFGIVRQPALDANFLSIYFTDALIFFIVLLWIFREVSQDNGWRSFLRKIVALPFSKLLAGFAAAFLLSVFVNIRSQADYILALRQIAQILEFYLLFLWVASNGYKKLWLSSAIVFISSMSLQSLLAIFQFFGQSNIGLKFLGEPSLDPFSPLTSQLNLDFGRFIRPYGTFGHPNILAAFLFVSITVIVWIYGKINKKRVVYFFGLAISFGLTLFALYITFARTALAVALFFILAIAIFYLLKNKLKSLAINNNNLIIFSAVFTIVSILFIANFYSLFVYRYQPDFNQPAVTERVLYAKEAFNLWSRSPIFGVGAGNFTQAYFEEKPGSHLWEYQPAHNIFLLTLAENGIIAFVFFALFIILTLKNVFKRSFPLFTFAACFIALGLFDHFFFTDQSGRIIFWIVIGYLISEIKTQERSS